MTPKAAKPAVSTQQLLEFARNRADARNELDLAKRRLPIIWAISETTTPLIASPPFAKLQRAFHNPQQRQDDQHALVPMFLSRGGTMAQAEEPPLDHCRSNAFPSSLLRRQCPP
jgi:hypothetical protein